MMYGMGRKYWMAAAAVVVLASTSWAASRKEFRYSVAHNSSVSIVNQYGPVTVKAGANGQVVITATTASDKVEVYSEQNGKRIETRTIFRTDASENEGRVEYEVTVPADTLVTVQSATGPIQASGMRGDVTLKGDSSTITARDISNAHVHVRNVSGAVNLANINGGHVEVVSTSGKVTLSAVNGPLVSVNTTSGDIAYDGDFGNAGDYTLSNHSGNIDVTLPSTASVDLTARSLKGDVQNDFPLHDKARISFPKVSGHAFAGTSNSGSSSVKLSSFGGTIRVKKR
jgi:DUF4097 and DUF4098 domain-containing protein YvlB